MVVAIESVEARVLDALLREAGCGAARAARPLAGGGNNRAFRVATEGGPAVLLKQYHRHRDDPRDRLGHEFALSTFAWGLGIRCVPEPLARDDAHALGLYRFIDGRMLRREEVTEARVAEAIAFFIELNRHHGRADSAALPVGSEACFCNLEHVALVDQRVRRLDAVEEPAAGAFVERELKPMWADLHPGIAKRADAMTPAPRCVSPSDFGFHNAMLTSRGCRGAGSPQTPDAAQPAEAALVFHDFEYAGWDDPAKLLGDFFHQPRRPVPWSAYAAFEDAVCDALTLGDEHRARFRMLLPVYRIKWCCIILNPLLPGGAARRRYAGVQREPAELIDAARQLLHAPPPKL